MRHLLFASAPARVHPTSRALAQRSSAWLQGALALGSIIALGGCSAPPGAVPVDDDNSDIPEYGGPAPSGVAPQMVQPGTGAASPGSTPGATGSSNTNIPPAAPAGNGSEQNGANGAPLNPSQPGNTGNSGAMNQGAAGSSMVPPPSGNQGAGGASMGGDGTGDDGLGDDGNPDPTPPPVEPPPVTPPPSNTNPPPTAPSGPDIPCPADATFCSGFEGAALPEGTNFVIGGDASFANQFAIDATQAHSGSQSLAIPGPSPGFSYRVLTIPAPGQDFWARLYIRVGSEFGDGNHDGLFGASNASMTADHNNETVIELSEQFGYVLLNTDDCTLACNAPQPQLTLPPDQWHCLEAHYDGNTGHVEVFLEGSRFIDATNAAHRFTFQTFRLGYMRFNTERSVWYDDVILSRSRVGCD